MLAIKVGGWVSPLRAFAACSWLVKLEVWFGGDARGVAISMGDADEAMAFAARKECCVCV